MFSNLIKYISPKKSNLEHKPLKHTFFRDPEVAKVLHEEGYYVADLLGEEERQKLITLYKDHHKIEDDQGGAFISTFSKDIAYREKMHDSIGSILAESFDKWFHDYKNIINIFFVKISGKSSKIPIHQDIAAVDEEKYSNLTVWIPLQEITPLNGALYLVPRSHNIFSPYRCRTITPFIKSVENDIYKYAQPVYLKPGQVVFFDSRIFHFSAPNLSGQTRLVAVSRIYPAGSHVISYFNEKGEDELKVEMWQCSDDYFLHLDDFTENTRPQGGKFLGYRVNPKPLTQEEFEKRKKMYGILPKNFVISGEAEQPNFIQEPVSMRTDPETKTI